MKKPCEYCGCDLPLGVDKDTRRIRSRHFSSCKARPSLEVESPAPVPTSWMEMVTVNLVREGVNKHKARELAEHFYSLAPAAQPAPVQEPLITTESSLRFQLECDKETLEGYLEEIRELKGVISRMKAAAQQEPVGWSRPTDEMVQAATDEYDEWAFDNKGTTECIRAMLAKALMVQPTAQPTPVQEVRLWDTQWTSVVNHDNAYRGWDKQDAINHAVKMTEQYIAKNVLENKCPPSAQPAVPDAFGTREGEHPQYIQGWNDCRAEMLKGMK
jgi:hypothetical protein